MRGRLAMGALHGVVLALMVALFGGPLWAAIGFGAVVYWIVAVYGEWSA